MPVMPIRKKIPYIVIPFDTTTDAMAMEAACADLGIPGRLIPLPREISAGCGLSWRIGIEEYEIFKSQIEDLGLSMNRPVRLLI